MKTTFTRRPGDIIVSNMSRAIHGLVAHDWTLSFTFTFPGAMAQTWRKGMRFVTIIRVY